MMRPMDSSNATTDAGYMCVSEVAQMREALEQKTEGYQPAILLDTVTPLGEITFDFPPPDRQIWLYARNPGRPATWIRRCQEFRDHRIFILLSDREPFAFSAIRILSSLGIPCGLCLESERPDWEAWSDILGYAAYAAVRHAAIEPFATAFREYRPERAEPFCMDALEILARGNRWMLAADANSHLQMPHTDDGKPDPDRSDRFFIERHPCSYCQAWRVCMGTFEHAHGEGVTTCQDFFREWMEACECAAIEK